MKNLFALLLCLCTAFSLLAQAPNANYDPDWDGDGNLGVSDLLGFLGLFGDFDTDGDGVWDSVDQCIDIEACNYDLNPSTPCTYVDAIDVCGGNCLEDSNEDGICDVLTGICGTTASITYFGEQYELISIGNQCWFKTNLKTNQFRNGDFIPTSPTNAEWQSATTPFQAIYDQDSVLYFDSFGRLYNWFAVDDARQLCPSGYHVGTKSDFDELYSFTGGQDVCAPNLKSTSEDSPPWNGNNSSGFSWTAHGNIGSTGASFGNGSNGGFWTSTQSSAAYGWWCSAGTNNSHITQLPNNSSSRDGRAVRCIQD